MAPVHQVDERSSTLETLRAEGASIAVFRTEDVPRMGRQRPVDSGCSEKVARLCDLARLWLWPEAQRNAGLWVSSFRAGNEGLSNHGYRKDITLPVHRPPLDIMHMVLVLDHRFNGTNVRLVSDAHSWWHCFRKCIPWMSVLMSVVLATNYSTVQYSTAVHLIHCETEQSGTAWNSHKSPRHKKRYESYYYQNPALIDLDSDSMKTALDWPETQLFK